MTIDPWQVSLFALALVGLLFSHVLRSPKRQVELVETRILALENEFDTLKVLYSGNHGRHDQALSSLTIAVTRLTDRFDQFMSANGQRGR